MKTQPRHSSDRLPDRKREAERRRDQAKAERSELREEIERGEHMPLDQVKRRDVARIRSVRDGLLTLPKTLGPVVAHPFDDGQRLEAIVERHVAGFIEKFVTT